MRFECYIMNECFLMSGMMYNAVAGEIRVVLCIPMHKNHKLSSFPQSAATVDTFRFNIMNAQL